MALKNGNLKPAHTGYRYQDISTAYFLIKALVEGYDSVIVDKKQVEDDRIDDLEICISGQRIRRQIKSSTDASRCISRSDFTGTRSTLRIDRLVLTDKRSISPVKEYRLCATWQIPAKKDDLIDLIEKIHAAPTFDNTRTAVYKLKVEKIWPVDSEPIWPVLSDYVNPSAEFGRHDFVKFCEKFLIELQLPIASADLLNPGPLELSVLNLLSDSVGIGRYPNQGRIPEDVAALAVSLANLARTQEATLQPNEISKKLEIRTDFGRVSQSFPVDKLYFHDRPSFRQVLRRKMFSGGVHIVTAPPGAGKSWELTRLAEELIDDCIVARHYCYLEPGDELVERRVTTDVFFANLISELYVASPEIESKIQRLSADLTTLEEALQHGIALGKQIVLIVDGLDHISRVRSSSSSLSDDETDIVEMLATLTIPKGVSLILGSQPGQHLDSLFGRREKDVFSHELPLWVLSDIVELAKLYKVDEALFSIGVSDPQEIKDILDILAKRSDGNPLYGRYLCNGLISGVGSEIINNPTDWLLASPIIGSDIAIYYKHLYKNILNQAQVIADLFGTIDFSVTESDLREILPSPLLSWIPSAMTALAPVITNSTGQGGIRIFHESFRRFMLDELKRQGRSIGNVLTPVISWLESRGFYRDSKSYRFLLPALRRADNNSKLIDLVGVNFVSESVSNGHPLEAIQKNLAITADVAGCSRNWPMIVRCAELRRALSTCFDLGQNSWNEFWETYAEIHGPVALAERLLFEGKPTLPYDEGLLACTLVDDHGVVAPWSEYLNLTPDESESHYDKDFDHSKYLTNDEKLSLAKVQGQIRLGSGWRLLKKFYKYIITRNNPRLFFVRKLAMQLSRQGFERSILKMATRSDVKQLIKPQLTPLAGFALRMGLADEYTRQGDNDSASSIARLALPAAQTANLATMCMDFGVFPDSPEIIADTPDSIPIGVADQEHFPEVTKLQQWVSSIRLLAITSKGCGAITKEESRIQGEGWYRCWLRYVIALAKATAAKQSDHPYDVDNVFSILAEDVRPFAGQPRPCDLYHLHDLIKETIAQGLSLIRTSSEWEHALEKLISVSNGTASRLDQEDGGPVSIGTVINLMLPYTLNPIVGKKIQSVIQSQVKEINNMGTYYATHAEYTMSLAKVQMTAGLTEEALNNWSLAGVYLTGYGWHKDSTLFDIIESVPVLIEESKNKALSALQDLQPLVAAVLIHTDGRSTKQAPNAWYSSLLHVDPSSALDLLARTIIEDDGIENWPTIKALEAVANRLCGKVDPMVLDALWETIPFKVEYENDSQRVAKNRLNALHPLFANYPDIASQRLVRLAAEAANDATDYNFDSVECIEKFASEHGKPIKCHIHKDTSDSNISSFTNSEHHKPEFIYEFRVPLFPFNSTVIDLIAGLRKVAKVSASQESEAFRYVSLYLGYRLDEMASQGNEASARRILHFFARDVELSLSSKLHPLGKIGRYLDNSGCISMATIAYSLAYTASRGGGGWYSFGDSSHSDVLQRAIALDRDLALQTVASEVAYRLRNTDYGAGISRGLIERIVEWGEPDIAHTSWREAFNVISSRLPLTRSSSWFAELDINDLSVWSLAQGVIALLLTRLLEPRLSRKIASLSGISKVILHRPEVVGMPLNWWLSRDTPISSLLLLLHLLLITEKAPYPITDVIHDQLSELVKTKCWGTSRLAVLLLERAGHDVPISTSNSEDMSHLPSPSRQEIESVHAFDIGGGLELLSVLWPELPERVSKELSPLLKSKTQIERINERLKLSFGREGKAYPQTPVMYWQTELFLSSLHSQAIGLNEQLWKIGNWSKNKEKELLIQSQPDIALHLAMFSSRVPRPAWDEPTQIKEGEGKLQYVIDDTRYQGWIRLALVEEQYIRDTHRSSRPIEKVQLYIGSVICPLETSSPKDYFPFIDGDHTDWWLKKPMVLYRPSSNKCLPLVSLTRCSDWLGDTFVLIPPKFVHIISNVKMPEFSAPLIWSDSNGEPLLALRSWHVRSGQFSVESDSIRGSDLIVRPDVIDRLEKLIDRPIKEYRHIVRQPIPER